MYFILYKMHLLHITVLWIWIFELFLYYKFLFFYICNVYLLDLILVLIGICKRVNIIYQDIQLHDNFVQTIFPKLTYKLLKNVHVIF